VILKDEAQVLHVYEQGNTSLVVVFYGRKLGQFRVHGKGSRRWSKQGFAGGFDLLARGEVLVYPRAGDNLWILKEWTETARPPLGRSLSLLRCASYLCELAETLSRPTAGSVNEERPFQFSSFQGLERPGALYPLLAAAADALADFGGHDPIPRESGVSGDMTRLRSNRDRVPRNGASRNGPGASGAVLLWFTLAALAYEGLLPQLDRCGQCGSLFARQPKRVWLTGEGLYCETCAASLQPGVRGEWLSLEAQKALKYVAQTAQAVRLSSPAAEQLARALILLVHGALEQDLLTLRAAAGAVYALGWKFRGT
jgi:recombinational DNA repair protein (RecF pathway)